MKTWKKLRADVKKRVRSAKRAFIKNRLNAEQNTKEWWDTLNTITNPNKNSLPSSTIIIDKQPMNPEAFCKNINNYYASVGGVLADTSVEPAIVNSTELEPLCLGEVKTLLKRLDTSKATSMEDFPTWVSSEGHEDICLPLLDILNTMLSTNEFPNLWKRAQIKPSPKVSMPTQYKDFRPISLLFHLGKVAEDVIITKLKGKLADIVDNSQFAYQSKLGTVDALIKQLDDFTLELDKAKTKFMQLAGVDFSKAFDRLQPPILIDKMRQHRFNENLTKLVANFLQDRKQCVKYGAVTSSYIDSEIGTPQGTKLGPLLWLIYCNDLSVEDYYHVKYADDTNFYIPVTDHQDSSAILPALNATKDWSASNNMILNASKTVIMNATLTNRVVHDVCFPFDDSVLKPCDTTKFLGVQIDKNLNFNAHTDEIIRKCRSRLFLMKKLRTIGLNVEGLKIFYTSNVRSVISYGAPAWYCFLSDTNKQRLENMQKSCINVILPEFNYDEALIALDLPKLNKFLFDISESHFSKILNNVHHPLHDRIIFNHDRFSSRSKYFFRPARCRTVKRQHSFFNYFMMFRNNNFIYLQ